MRILRVIAAALALLLPATAATAQVPTDFLGYWSLNETSGPVVDAGGGHDGTAVGITRGVPGVAGNAARFSGNAGSHVLIPHTPDFPTNQVTILAWVKFDVLNGDFPMFLSGGGNDGLGWDYALYNEAGTHFRAAYRAANGSTPFVDSTTMAQPGVWYHVAMTHDGTNLSIYVNGVKEATVAAPPLAPSVRDFYLGREARDYCCFLNGSLDEVQLYGRSLVPAEMAAIHQAGVDGEPLGDVGGPSDTTPPSVVATVTGVLGNNNWYTSSVDVAWTVTDGESTAVTDGCDAQSVSYDTSGVTFTCSATSDGGTATESVTVKRDATAPMISGSRTPAANGAGWNNTDVAVSFTCSDGVSGVASCSGDTTLSSEGAGQSASGTATDQAGNAAQASVGGISIDKTAPVVSVPANVTADATSDAGAVVTFAAATASDALSGAGTVSCTRVSGTTFAIGTTTVSCSATDAAGNTGTASFTVTVNDVTTPGHMHGDGFVKKNSDKYHFGFEVRERGGRERARLTLRVDYGKRAVVDRKGKTKYEKPEDDVFRSTDVDFVAFSDDPTIRPGRRRRVQIDTVLFSGNGRWNGQSGYTYEVSAEDAGEPGRHREAVTITIRNGAGQVVAQVSGELDGGNVQSSRISHGHHHRDDRD